MKKVGYILLGLLLLLGCQNITYPKKPKDLIPEEKMVEILIDIHLFAAAKTSNRSILENTGLSANQLIYEKHQIDSTQFRTSNEYYGADLEKFGRIHSKVKDYLEAKKVELDTLISEETRKKSQDSLIEKTKDLSQR